MRDTLLLLRFKTKARVDSTLIQIENTTTARSSQLNAYLDLQTSDGQLLLTTNTLNTIPQEAFRIYPIPTQNELQLEFAKDFKPVQLQLISLDGRMVGNYTNLDQKISLSLSHLPSGMYWAKLLTKEGVLSKKFVLE